MVAARQCSRHGFRGRGKRAEYRVFLREVVHPAGEAAGQTRGLFVVAGGVAANRTVRATLQATAEKNGFAFLAPPMAYSTDNAAMIALAGAERLRKGLVSDIDTAARPRWPLDEYSALNDPTHAPGRKGAKA